MSAAELIEQIKALPPGEQEKVAVFVHSMHTGEEQAADGVRRIDQATFAKAKAAVFQKHDEVLRRLAQ